MQTIRASRLPAANRCPAIIATCEDVSHLVPKEIGGDLSALGQAYHSLQAARAQGVEVDEAGITQAAMRHHVSVDDLTWLWERVDFDPKAGNPDFFAAEAPLEMLVEPDDASGQGGVTLTGTADIVRIFSKSQQLDAIDWKTGRLAVDEEPAAWGHWQVIAYMVMAVRIARTNGWEIDRGRVIVYPVRLGDQPTIFEFGTPALIEQAEREVREIVSRAHAARSLEIMQRSFRVGSDCRFCDARRICPAYKAEMQQALSLVADGSIFEITPENAEKAFETRQLASKLTDGLDKALKEHVEFFGPLPVSERRELKFLDYEAKPHLAVKHVEAVLEAMRKEKSIRVSHEKVAELIHRLENRAKVPARRFGRYKIKES